ncbi:DinB family protein [Kribbella sp. NPDC058245]|uniref:DinB family protein n=1 Tax=Kribbella sp. NPDC058245 TaxID=3346399 RepID=UPI0036EF0164
MTENLVGRDFRGGLVREVDFRGARFERVGFIGAVMRGVEFNRASVDGDIEGLVINGVEVGPLIEAELDRRDPERVKMRPADADGFREGWDVVERLWAGTVERARALPPAKLHERVDGEWSFIQTLRHLVYATDVWMCRVIQGDPEPWDALSLPFDGATPDPRLPWDLDVQPSLDEVLKLRHDRMGRVRRYVDQLTDAELDSQTTPVEGPSWPRRRRTTSRCVSRSSSTRNGSTACTPSGTYSCCSRCCIAAGQRVS